jgi:hypothetical protein
MPTPYALPIDVARRFDPQITQSELGSDSVIGQADTEQIRTRASAIAAELEGRTGTAFRAVRVGNPGAPTTYEHHAADEQADRFENLVDLDHQHVVPLDPAVDVLEIRTGRDTWEDVTDASGDEWVLNEVTGRLKTFRLLIDRVYFEAPDDRHVRISYRHGALGGGRDRGGETTLGESVTASQTGTVDVADAGRLPADGGAVLLGQQPSTAEYVRLSGADASANTVTIAERGVRRTDSASHDTGDAVHYCPLDIRDAVAGQTAAELVNFAGWNGHPIARDTDDGPSPTEKAEGWAAEFDAVCQRTGGHVSLL